MTIPLRRDSQQWMYEIAVQDTGKTFHFQGDGRGGLPRTIRQHDMISKHLARRALRLRQLAREEEQAGHDETALELYFDAASVFGHAQHPIFETNEEKRLLHGLSLECFAKVAELAPYPIEHVEIPWGEDQVFGQLHLMPAGEPAPCVIFVPGCDMTKEMYPHPLFNPAHQRGMHVISIEGPGHGENNIAGVKWTGDNYEHAIGAVVDYLESRPEVDSDRIVLYAHSFSNHWGFRHTAVDHRVRAHAAHWASLADKRFIADHESPRWKQLFAYMTGVESEEQLDRLLAATALDELAPQVRCPTLITVGEYDPRSPIEEIQRIYDLMTCERELQIYEDQHHACTASARDAGLFTIWAMDALRMPFDWLRDRLLDKPIATSGAVTWIAPGGAGPSSSEPVEARTWLEAIGLGAPAESTMSNGR